MIQANELRVGNYIEIEQYNHIRNIVRICSGSEIDQVIKLRPAPIPLTPEILEKCGFALNSVDQLSIEINSMDRHLELNAEVNGNYFFSINQVHEFGEQSNVTLNYTNYLHQLQNLYFALTNSELTFKP